MNRRWPFLAWDAPLGDEEDDCCGEPQPGGLELRLLGDGLPPNAIIFVQDPSQPSIYWSCPVSLEGELETFEMDDGTLDVEFNGDITYYTEKRNPCPVEVLRVAATSAAYGRPCFSNDPADGHACEPDMTILTSWDSKGYYPRIVAIARYLPNNGGLTPSHDDVLHMAGRKYLELYSDSIRKLDGAKQDYKNPD